MTCNYIYKFNHVNHFGDHLIIDGLEHNLKQFLNWGFLCIGAWYDVNIPTSGAFGGDFSKLYPRDDPSFTLGRIWESTRKDWVYETGINYVDMDNVTGNPLRITGVSVNGISYGTGHATYGHYIDYPLGRVVFNSAIPTNSNVQVKYSYRQVQVYVDSEASWWKELQYNTYRPDDSHYALTSSGDWDVLANNRVQLPSVIIEVIPRGTSYGYELGNSSLVINQEVIFHILSENKYLRNQIADILRFQQDKTIYLFDSNSVYKNNAFPLDYKGMINPSGKFYPNLINNYTWLTASFNNTSLNAIDTLNPSLYAADIRSTMSLIFNNM